MKPYKRILFYNAFLAVAIFSGCASLKNSSLSLFGSSDQIDPSLPMIKKIKTINDVKSIGFEWEKIDNIALIKGIVIYRVQKGGVLKKLTTIKNPLATHYYDTDLIPQTQYAYEFSTLGYNGLVSTRTPVLNVKTSFIDPIESVFASIDYPREIKLIWSPHPNPSISRYIIQRQNEKGVFLNIGTIKNRLYVEYFDKELQDGKEYKYRILAESFEGAKSLPSVVVTGKTKPEPISITELHASNNLARSIRIDWKKSLQEDVVRYKIYSASSLRTNFTLAGETKNNFYIHKVNEDGVERFYKVVPVDNVGIEGAMPVHSAKGMTLRAPIAPIITRAVIENNRAIIQWQKINDTQVKGYIVYRYEGKFSSKALRFSDITKNEFIDKEMKTGKKYRYQVASIDKNGLESKPSESVELLLK